MTIVRKGRLTNVNFSVQLIFRTCAFVGKRRGHVYVHKTIVSNLWHYGGSRKLRHEATYRKTPPRIAYNLSVNQTTRGVLYGQKTASFHDKTLQVALLSLVTIFLSRIQLLLKEN